MPVSHETIYTWIYAQPKGELARAGIILRTGREQRKPRGRKKSTGAKIVGMRSIDERPAEAAGRQVPGHWEGDLVIGKGGKSAMGTLVERVSRFLCPVALPHGHDADSVRDALFDAVKDLPAHLRKSLTCDQGTEMARHAAHPGGGPSAVFRPRPFPVGARPEREHHPAHPGILPHTARNNRQHD